ncbi:MAG: AMP-binding protein [bacterium]
MDLSHWIVRRAAFSPGHTAIHFQGEKLGYGALAALVDRTAGLLKHGLAIARGDRVAVLAHNNPNTLALLFACARLGAILVPLNWRLAAPEHVEILENCTPGALIVQPSFVPGLDGVAAGLPPLKRVVLGPEQGSWNSFDALMADAGDWREHDPLVNPDSPVLICYTSGTTGRPKGAVLSQNALFYNAVNSTDMHALTRADRVLTTLPLFHVGGLNVQTLPALHAGATVVLHDQFDPGETLKAIAEHRITLTVLVPTQISALLALPGWEAADLSSLRLVTTGSTIVPDHLVRAVQQRGVPVIPVYGSTETAPVAAYLSPRESERKLGSTGTAGLHAELRIVDEAGREVAPGVSGEVLVRGPIVMNGYWGDPTTSAEALKGGWFHSGDIGHLDGEGFLYIDDRKKDVIISGGENVYPAGLENLLAECDWIAEAAVVGLADAHWGEKVVAVVVAATPGDPSPADVLALFDGRVARYKHPREVVFVDRLPRNAMGTVHKDKVRDMAAALAAGGEK